MLHCVDVREGRETTMLHLAERKRSCPSDLLSLSTEVLNSQLSAAQIRGCPPERLKNSDLVAEQLGHSKAV
jgi:hypothetical protein